MPLNFFLMEIIVNNCRLSTFPVIDERSRIEFSMPTTGIRITMHDNEFKRPNRYSCSTCLFTADAPWRLPTSAQVDKHGMQPSSSEEPEDGGCFSTCSPNRNKSKQIPSKTSLVDKSKSLPSKQKPHVLHVEVFKDHPSSGEKHSVGKGIVDVQPLLDRIGKRIAEFDEQKPVTSVADDCQKPNDENKPRKPYPVTENFKAIYPLLNDGGEHVGAICVLLRLTCFDVTMALSPAAIWQPPPLRKSNNVEETVQVLRL